MKKPIVRATVRKRRKHEKVDLDALDRVLLAAKEENPFLSARELAEYIGLSASPTAERIRWLREYEYIDDNRASVVNYRRVGFGVEALVEIALDSTAHRKTETVLPKLRGLPMIRRCWLVTGDSDFVAQVFARGVEDLKEVIEKIGKIEGVSRTRTNVVLERVIDNQKVPLQALPDFDAALREWKERPKTRHPKRRGRQKQ